MKKSICLFLCVLMLLSPFVYSATAFASAYTYVENNDSDEEKEVPEFATENVDAFSLKLTRYNGDKENVVIPDTVDGKPIVAVGGYCFDEDVDVKSVTLPKTVKSIGTKAFYHCYSLESINLENVESVGKKAFAGCEKLDNLALESVQSIDEYAFGYCSSAENITIGDSIFYIGTNAFYNSAAYKNALGGSKRAFYLGNCLIKVLTNRGAKKFRVKSSTTLIAENAFHKIKKKNKSKITYVYLPDSVKTLCWRALDEKSIKKIRLPKGIENLSSSAFSEKYYNKNRTYKDGCYYLNNYLLDCKPNALKIKIKKGTTVIANSALYGCLAKKIVIPKGVKYLGYDAISACPLLKTVSVPDTVIKIDEGNFINNGTTFSQSSKNLVSINVNKNNKYYASVDGVLYNKEITELIAYPNNKACEIFKAPSTLKTVKARSFAFANNLTGIELNDGLETVETQAFANCKIKEVTFPESVSYIGRCAIGYYFYFDEDEGGYFLMDGFTVSGKKGSAAEQYCTERIIAYYYDDDDDIISDPIPFKEV